MLPNLGMWAWMLSNPGGDQERVVGAFLELHHDRFAINHDRPSGIDEVVEQVTRFRISGSFNLSRIEEQLRNMGTGK